MLRTIRGAGLAILMSVLMVATGIQAQESTIGLLVYDEEQAANGYTLYTARRSGDVFLIDMQGNVVNHWQTGASQGRDAFLLENGNIMRTLPLDGRDTFFDEARTGFGGTGRVAEIDWNDEIVWEWQSEDPRYWVHHGIDIMPNGNVLVIAFDYYTVEEAIERGLNPEVTDEITLTWEYWPDSILEISRETGEVVWAWNAWDHLIQDFDPSKENYGDPAANPGRIDINYNRPTPRDPEGRNAGDWIHANTVAYNPELDQVMLSAREFDELWVIDHSISTEEAAGPAGDLLYRWGNPAAYGAEGERRLFRQHDTQWIAEGLPGAGNILVYNNRVPLAAEERSEDYPEQTEQSTVIEFAPPDEDGVYPELEAGEAYGPEALVWEYESEPPQEFFSGIVSGTQRLSNGNTLIIEGTSGNMFEVTRDGEVVWQFVNPVTPSGLLPQGAVDLPDRPNENSNMVFRARRYMPDHPGLVGRDLTPIGTMAEVMGSE